MSQTNSPDTEKKTDVILLQKTYHHVSTLAEVAIQIGRMSDYTSDFYVGVPDGDGSNLFISSQLSSYQAGQDSRNYGVRNNNGEINLSSYLVSKLNEGKDREVKQITDHITQRFTEKFKEFFSRPLTRKFAPIAHRYPDLENYPKPAPELKTADDPIFVNRFVQPISAEHLENEFQRITQNLLESTGLNLSPLIAEIVQTNPSYVKFFQLNLDLIDPDTEIYEILSRIYEEMPAIYKLNQTCEQLSTPEDSNIDFNQWVDDALEQSTAIQKTNAALVLSSDYSPQELFQSVICKDSPHLAVYENYFDMSATELSSALLRRSLPETIYDAFGNLVEFEIIGQKEDTSRYLFGHANIEGFAFGHGFINKHTYDSSFGGAGVANTIYGFDNRVVELLEKHTDTGSIFEAIRHAASLINHDALHQLSLNYETGNRFEAEQKELLDSATEFNPEHFAVNMSESPAQEILETIPMIVQQEAIRAYIQTEEGSPLYEQLVSHSNTLISSLKPLAEAKQTLPSEEQEVYDRAIRYLLTIHHRNLSLAVGIDSNIACNFLKQAEQELSLGQVAMTPNRALTYFYSNTFPVSEIVDFYTEEFIDELSTNSVIQGLINEELKEEASAADIKFLYLQALSRDNAENQDLHHSSRILNRAYDFSAELIGFNEALNHHIAETYGDRTNIPEKLLLFDFNHFSNKLSAEITNCQDPIEKQNLQSLTLLPTDSKVLSRMLYFCSDCPDFAQKHLETFHKFFKESDTGFQSATVSAADYIYLQNKFSGAGMFGAVRPDNYNNLLPGTDRSAKEIITEIIELISNAERRRTATIDDNKRIEFLMSLGFDILIR